MTPSPCRLCISALLCLATSSTPGHAQQHFGGSAPLSAFSAPLPSAPAPNPSPEPVTRPVSVAAGFHIAPAVNTPSLPGKLAYYLASTVSIRNLAEAVAIGGVPDITSAPSQPLAPANPSDTAAAAMYQSAMETYGDNMDRWRRTNDVTLRYHAARFETGLATAETRQFLSNLVLPLALHQQARYVPAAEDATLGQRLWHAAGSVVVTRNDAGFLVPNYSKLGGTVGAAFLGKSLFASTFNAPELDSNHFVASYIGYSLLGDLATNTAHELVRAATAPDAAMYALHGSARDDSYYPLSLGGKIVAWGRSTYALRNFAEGAFMAGVPQVPDQPVEPDPGVITTDQQASAYNAAFMAWGTAELGWKRTLEGQLRYREHAFLGGFSESETQMFLGNLVLPVALGLDPRYLPLGPGHAVGTRLGHALRGLVITHTDSGSSFVNVPLLGGTVGAAFAAQQLYYPELGTTRLETNDVMAKTISLNLAADALGNLYAEFLGHGSH